MIKLIENILGRNQIAIRSMFFLFWFLPITYNLFPITYSYATVPHLIDYQGRLTDSSGAPLNGSVNLTFRIYDAQIAGNLLWQENQAGVVVQKGVFSVLLGSVTALNLPFDKQYYLSVQVNSDSEMNPRQIIMSVGYSIRAETAEAADRIKADVNDPLAGFLSEKIDNSTIKLDQTNHKIYTPHGAQFFTSNGTFTAPAGVTTVFITAVAGGGGGAKPSGYQAGGGGGGGQCVIKCPYTVVGGNSYTVTIGAAGTGYLEGGAAATAGGNTVFDTLTCLGGQAPAAGSTTHALGYTPDGASGTGGTRAQEGVGGVATVYTGKGGIGADHGAGGGGGGSPFGIGGAGGNFGVSYPQSGTGYGSGGGGVAYQANGNGGNGTAGFCLVEW